MSEKEISLSKLFYRILRDWRKCFIIALIGAVIVGGGTFAQKKIQFSDSKKLENAKEEYERKVAAYNLEGEDLQRGIENLEKIRDQQEMYNEESILMQIDPLHTFNASVQIYVSTDYKIVPELTYQNVDITGRVLSSYAAYMRNGKMYQYITDHITEKTELRYLQETFSVSVDYDTGMITLRIRGRDENSCEEAITYAIEGIYEKQKEILETVGEHELSLLNQVTYETVDTDLDTWQTGKRQYILDLNEALIEKEEALTAWKRSSVPQQQYEITLIIKDSVKKMILAFIVIFVLIAVGIMFHYIVSDKVQDAKDLKNRFGLRLITQIPKVHRKRIWGLIDRMFARVCGLTLLESDAEKLFEMAVQSINAELTVCADNTDKKDRKIVFTGSIGDEEVSKFFSGIEWEEGVSACCVFNFLSNPYAVSAVMDADYVILVEKQEESRCSQIELELENLAAWKKKVLGVIVLEVDGIPT